MQVTGRAREARPGPSRILRTLQDAFSRPASTRWAVCRCIWEVLKAFLVGGDDAQLLFSWPSVATLFSSTLL